ncbi:hypothetical protein WDU94_005097 [Cyamophila willieti]
MFSPLGQLSALDTLTTVLCTLHLHTAQAQSNVEVSELSRVVVFPSGWSIQVHKDQNRKHDIDEFGKNKRDYQFGSNHVNLQYHQSPSPSPVNYYQHSGGFDLKPPASPWSNQFYQPNYQIQQNNLASLLGKCSEQNLYYCKELFAKQLVQHVREMVTYHNGLDPYFLSVILGKLPSLDSGRTPFTHTEIRTETDLLDNEIPNYKPQINPQRPEKGHLYSSNAQWNPIAWQNNFNPKPIAQSWNDYYRPQEPTTPSNYRPYFMVPQANDYFKPLGYNYDPLLTFPYKNGAQDGFREVKEYPHSHHKSKVCNPCAPSNSQDQIDIRNKVPEQQDTTNKNDNSTVPTSRA